MSEFGTHEPQPNEGNGDANNHTSKTLSKSLDHATPVRTHTFTEHRGKHGRLGAAKRPHAQRPATCSSHRARCLNCRPPSAAYPAPAQPILSLRHRRLSPLPPLNILSARLSHQEVGEE